MKLNTELIKLPLEFDAALLAAEISRIPEASWRPHPQGYAGNSALPLIAAGGNPANDATKGPMRPTPHLDACPLLRQTLAAFGTVLGRTRLMRLDGNSEATAHSDTNYYWLQRVRIHVPVVTDPAVRFLCGDRETHMAAGEAWIFDTWKRHNVINPNPTRRIHLVADSVGSAAFWDLVSQAGTPPRQVAFDPNSDPQLAFETVNQPVVMTPWEQDSMFNWFFADLTVSETSQSGLVSQLRTEIEPFRRDWAASWSRYGEGRDGWPTYRRLLADLEALLVPYERRLHLPNGAEAIEIARQMVVRPALNPDLAASTPHAAAAGVAAVATASAKPSSKNMVEPGQAQKAPKAPTSQGTTPPVAAATAAPSTALPPVATAATAPTPGTFGSVFTSELPAIFKQLGISLLVSTYQTGRVIAVRGDGDTISTHFRAFASPMGLAVGPHYLAIGTQRHVWEYRNQPSVGRKLPPPGKHDACFMPRRSHVTGDIRIHELAFAKGGVELWIVNTRFSCLSLLDTDHSFVPRWRPRFVTALAPEDRCHLNGLAIVDDRPRYVTALGETNTAQGWREHKATGGLLIDIESGETVARNLSMPHSPRWHGGRLWVLESGKGEVGYVDPLSGQVTTVARLPGFTRGLAFAGPYAFVGLSQVRESNMFGGIPLSDRLEEKQCGIWVLDLRSGKLAGFLRFEGLVQEIFDLQVLANIRFPEIVEPDSDLIAGAFVLPAEALAEVALAAPARPPA